MGVPHRGYSHENGETVPGGVSNCKIDRRFLHPRPRHCPCRGARLAASVAECPDCPGPITSKATTSPMTVRPTMAPRHCLSRKWSTTSLIPQKTLRSCAAALPQKGHCRGIIANSLDTLTQPTRVPKAQRRIWPGDQRGAVVLPYAVRAFGRVSF